jgi:hypothetical protein
MARKEPLVTTDQELDVRRQMRSDYADFVYHVVGSLGQLRDHMYYGAHSHYVDEWPDSGGGFLMALAMAGTRAFCEENGYTVDDLRTQRSDEVAEWIIYHPLQMILVDEAYALIDKAWCEIEFSELYGDVKRGDVMLICHNCGGTDHSCY